MARLFGISVADEILSLDAELRGEVTFTVTNNSPRPVRGRAKVVPLNSTRSEWLRISGEVERNFQTQGTHQIVVLMEVPPGTPPGNYAFRLDMASTSNPEEEFTEGPIVAAAVASVPSKKSYFPWWLIAAGAVVLLIAGGIAAYLALRKIEVPNVREKPLAEARSELEKRQFVVQTTEGSSETALVPGTVLEQDPEPGTRIKSGSVVKLIIQAQVPVNEPVTLKMPKLREHQESTAVSQLESACEPRPCVPIEIVYEMSGSVGSREVIRTVPEAEAEIRPGDKVTVYVNRFVLTRSLGLGGTQGVYALDVETGNTGDPSGQMDLVLDLGEKVLRTGGSLSPARFLAFGTKVGPDWCLTLPPSNAAFDRVALESVSEGLCACIRTSEGNISEVNITDVQPDRLAIWYRVWLDSP